VSSNIHYIPLLGVMQELFAIIISFSGIRRQIGIWQAHQCREQFIRSAENVQHFRISEGNYG
jgi:hypothetical protein